jgi:TetR/AcrR family transcriptional regulator
MLIGIERMPWIPSTWMREVLNEGGLLRTRVLRHLPLEKARMISEAITHGQAQGALNPEIDPAMIVFSAIGLVMMHSATAPFYAQIFHRKVPDRQSLCRHITGLLLRGLDARNEGRRKQNRK